jgi:N-acyl-D-amino-acid deacylase
MNYQQIFELTSHSSYEPTQEESFEHLSGEANSTPQRYLYDFLTKDGLSMAIMFFTNYTDYSLNAVREMQLDSATVTGLSDAGAHVSLIFDAVNPTYQLTYWARDRARGDTLPLGYVIHRATYRNAQLFGFKDRGHIAVGKKADINVIDFENLSLGELHIRRDLPAGGQRLMQGAHGYLATLINGQLTRRFDKPTGTYSGRLLRSS